VVVFVWIQFPHPELRSEVLLYLPLSKQLVLIVLWFTTHIECFDLGRNLVEIVFRSVGVVPRIGLLVNVP